MTIGEGITPICHPVKPKSLKTKGMRLVWHPFPCRHDKKIIKKREISLIFKKRKGGEKMWGYTQPQHTFASEREQNQRK